MKRLRIYVAGPVTSHDKEIVRKNIETARKIGEQILKLGHLPYVPHTHFYEWDVCIHKNYDLLQEHGNEVLDRWAEAIFFIAPSKGANLEKERAEKLGLMIFTSIEELEEFRED